MCFDCLTQELVDKGETLNPADVVKRLQRDDGVWRSKNVTVKTGGGESAGTSRYHYTDVLGSCQSQVNHER